MRFSKLVGGLLPLLVLGSGAAASAQTIGSFSWQTQPYCNVVTLTIVQVGTHYQLAGADDLCGAGLAPVRGSAVVTGGGVALGFTVALPSGPAAHLTATIDLASVSGSWNDADGHTGSFAFGGAVAGAPRPVPASVTAITTVQFAPSVYAGTGTAATIARSDHTHDARYYTKAEADARSTRAAFANGTGFTDITSPSVVGAVSITAPVAGVLVATGVATILDGSGTEYACSIGTAGVVDPGSAQYLVLATAEGVITTIRHIPVAAGTHTVSLVCEATLTGTGMVARPKLSVVFIPN